MKRIKITGLLAIVTLALAGLVGAASASASGFVLGNLPSGTAFVSGKTSPEIYFQFNGLTPDCYGQSFEARMSKPAPASITTEPLSGKLTCNGGIWSMEGNGCKFTFKPGSEKEAGLFGGTFDIGPSGCGPIKLNGTGCTITIGAQTGLAANFRSLGSGSSAYVSIEPHATNLKYTSTGGLCGSSGENGQLTGSWKTQSYSNAGLTTETGIKVANSWNTGLHIGGVVPQFEAAGYPLSVSGAQSGVVKWTLPSAGNIKCTTVTLGANAAGATSALSLKALQTGCVAFGQNASVSMNSCQYKVDVTNAGPPYAGVLSVTCEEGYGIKIKSATCTVTIPEQTIGSVSYENAGSALESHVISNLSSSGFTYTSTGGLCGPSGSDGTLSGAFDLGSSSTIFQ